MFASPVNSNHIFSIHPVYVRQIKLMLGKAISEDTERTWERYIRIDRRVSWQVFAQISCIAVKTSNKSWLGLELGAAPSAVHGSLVVAALSAATYRDSLQVGVDYGRLRSIFTCELSDTADGYSVLRAVNDVDWGNAMRFAVDAVIGVTLKTCFTALGLWPEGVRVYIPLSKPEWAQKYSDFAPVEFIFSAKHLEFHFKTETLALPCIYADEKLHASAIKMCKSEIAELTQNSLSERVANYLFQIDTGIYPSLTDMADLIAMSPRTLIRKLKLEGTSYQFLLDAARQSQTLWFMQHTEMSFEEIAANLGYLDATNFSRTVKRWFNITPSQLRDQCRVISPINQIA